MILRAVAKAAALFVHVLMKNGNFRSPVDKDNENYENKGI